MSIPALVDTLADMAALKDFIQLFRVHILASSSLASEDTLLLLLLQLPMEPDSNGYKSYDDAVIE